MMLRSHSICIQLCGILRNTVTVVKLFQAAVACCALVTLILKPKTSEQQVEVTRNQGLSESSTQGVWRINRSQFLSKLLIRVMINRICTVVISVTIDGWNCCCCIINQSLSTTKYIQCIRLVGKKKENQAI